MTLQIGPVTVDGCTVLAPMAGYTDVSFRPLCREQGAALMVTEMVSAEGLLRGVPGAWRMAELHAAERPVAVQLYGSDPQRLADAAAAVVDRVAPDLIDLNMGCPARKVIRKGAGVALMRQPELAERVVRLVRAAVSCPVTVKIRSGWSADEVNAPEVAQRLQDAGADALTVHARTRSQLHGGEADWRLIAQLREQLSIPVIGNGGVVNGATAMQMLRTTGVEAVMVGRAAIGNPWVFREIEAAVRGQITPAVTDDELREAVRRHLDDQIEARRRWSMPAPEPRACAHIRGHLARYASGRPGSVTFRRGLMRLTSREAVLAAVDELLDTP